MDQATWWDIFTEEGGCLVLKKKKLTIDFMVVVVSKLEDVAGLTRVGG